MVIVFSMKMRVCPPGVKSRQKIRRRRGARPAQDMMLFPKWPPMRSMVAAHVPQPSHRLEPKPEEK